MRISFDPHDSEDVRAVRSLLDMLGATLRDAVPPPPPVVPCAPPPPPPPSDPATAFALSGDVERDVDGVAWDPSAHAKSKAKTADGRWRKRRGGPVVSVVAPPPPPPSPSAPPPPPPPPGATTWKDICEMMLQIGADPAARASVARALADRGIDTVALFQQPEKYEMAASVIRGFLPNANPFA